MKSVMLAISHLVMLSRMAQSSFKSLHKIGSIEIFFLIFPIKGRLQSGHT